jgi:hypothetical protein
VAWACEYSNKPLGSIKCGGCRLAEVLLTFQEEHCCMELVRIVQ